MTVMVWFCKIFFINVERYYFCLFNKWLSLCCYCVLMVETKQIKGNQPVVTIKHLCVWAMRDTRLGFLSWFYCLSIYICKWYKTETVRYDDAMPGVLAGGSVNKTCLMLTEVCHSAALVL